MENLTLKQKIILGVVLGIMIITIGIYVFFQFYSGESILELNNSGNIDELIQQKDNLIRR